jgi:ABC-type sugar transport system permease subunit
VLRLLLASLIVVVVALAFFVPTLKDSNWFSAALIFVGLAIVTALIILPHFVSLRELGLQLPSVPPLAQFLIRLAGLAILDAVTLPLALNIYDDGNWFLAVAMVIATVVVNVINLLPQFWPVRWMTPAFALLILLAVYPLIYTVYVAFTNYSALHFNTKDRVIERLETENQYMFRPSTSKNYLWMVFRNGDGDYALWLQNRDDATDVYFAREGQELEAVVPGQVGEGPYTENNNMGLNGVPASYEGYTRIETNEWSSAGVNLIELQGVQFGNDESPVKIAGRTEAGDFRPRWRYDAEEDALVDESSCQRKTDGSVVPNSCRLYKANNKNGRFVYTTRDGEQYADLSFWVPVGFDNFKEIFSSNLMDGPLFRIFLWTVSFAFFAVLTSFSMGLAMALILNDSIPGVRIIRSLLIIPWTIPGIIGVLIWRGMLNSNLGVIPETMRDIFGWAPPFFTDAAWAKFAILLVNLWFAYPYFMLITSGAIQSIPSSIYEAAEVDGATPWHKFWKLTMPLLLVSVGPLLVASFIFNFNNYILIESLNDGGPQMTGTYAPPVGHTDNLMTYTYNYAFSAEGGSGNFGLASAIAVVIFIMVGLLTLFQFRLTKKWEEVGENV